MLRACLGKSGRAGGGFRGSSCAIVGLVVCFCDRFAVHRTVHAISPNPIPFPTQPIGSLYREYTFRPAPGSTFDLPLSMGITLSPAEGVPVTVHKRD